MTLIWFVFAAAIVYLILTLYLSIVAYSRNLSLIFSKVLRSS